MSAPKDKRKFVRPPPGVTADLRLVSVRPSLRCEVRFLVQTVVMVFCHLWQQTKKKRAPTSDPSSWLLLLLGPFGWVAVCSGQGFGLSRRQRGTRSRLRPVSPPISSFWFFPLSLFYARSFSVMLVRSTRARTPVSVSWRTERSSYCRRAETALFVCSALRLFFYNLLLQTLCYFSCSHIKTFGSFGKWVLGLLVFISFILFKIFNFIYEKFYSFQLVFTILTPLVIVLLLSAFLRLQLVLASFAYTQPFANFKFQLLF